MTVPTDPYNFVAGNPAVADQVDARFLPLYTALAGAIDYDNLSSALLDKLGVSSATIRRGKSIIPGAESRTNTAYGLLGTPDRVSSVAVPTDGLALVSYEAVWSSTLVAARAALHIGGTQVKIADGLNPAPQTQAAVSQASSITSDSPLTTCAAGLIGLYANAPYAPVTTGQIRGGVFAASTPASGQMEVGGGLVNVGPATSGSTPIGGWMVIDIAAGTYDFDVRFKSASGTVTVKNRKLHVVTIGF